MTPLRDFNDYKEAVYEAQDLVEQLEIMEAGLLLGKTEEEIFEIERPKAQRLLELSREIHHYQVVLALTVTARSPRHATRGV